MHYVNNSLFWYDQYHRKSADLQHDPLLALTHSAALVLPNEKSADELMMMDRADLCDWLLSRLFALQCEFKQRMCMLFGLTGPDMDRLDELAED